MIVAGFDLATVSGCAVLDGSRVLHVEAFKAGGDQDGPIFAAFKVWFRGTLLAHQVQHAAIEQPLRTPMIDPKTNELSPKSNMATYLRLYGLRGHALAICAELHIPCEEVNQMTWRKAFVGNGRAKKADALALARQLVPSLKSNDAAEAIGVAWWLQGHLSPLGQLGMRGAA
jgi:hypothetical protein